MKLAKNSPKPQKNQFPVSKRNVARKVLHPKLMPSINYMNEKASLSAGHKNGANHQEIRKPGVVRHPSQTVTHELTNILATVQGYADRLAMRHWEDPALTADVKLISEAARHTFSLVRNALNQKIRVSHFRKISPHPLQPEDPAPVNH